MDGGVTMSHGFDRIAPPSAGFYVTAADFSLTTWQVPVGDVAVSGREVRRIGLAAPWEQQQAWKRLVRQALKRGRISDDQPTSQVSDPLPRAA